MTISKNISVIDNLLILDHSFTAMAHHTCSVDLMQDIDILELLHQLKYCLISLHVREAITALEEY